MILRSFQIDEEFAEDDLEANLQRDKHARLCNSVNQLIDELTPAAPDFQLQEACNQLVSIWFFPVMRYPLIGTFDQLAILTDAPEMLSQLVSSHGMLAILEVLEGNCSREVNMKLLHIVNLVRPPNLYPRSVLTLSSLSRKMLDS